MTRDQAIREQADQPTLSELVLRVRAARPELAGLPAIHPLHGWWCDEAYNDFRLLEATARSIVVGVLAEYVAERGCVCAKSPGKGQFQVGVSPIAGLWRISWYDDYLSALVAAVCGEGSDAK